MSKSQSNPIKILIWIGVVIAVCLFFIYVKNIVEKRQASPISQTKPNLDNLTGLVKMNPINGLPYPGTYDLEKIFEVPNYSVLDSSSALQPLHKYTQGKITLLTFFYERCSDVNGCPYAMNVFQMVKAKLEIKNKDNEQFLLLSISFDPEIDTTVMFKGLEKKVSNNRANSIDWFFLTEKSITELLPIIDGFGQNVDVIISSITGGKSLTYQHVLKVFLIDETGTVREIYSTAYLNQEVILNDIETLLLKQDDKRVIN